MGAAIEQPQLAQPVGDRERATVGAERDRPRRGVRRQRDRPDHGWAAQQRRQQRPFCLGRAIEVDRLARHQHGQIEARLVDGLRTELAPERGAGRLAGALLFDAGEDRGADRDQQQHPDREQQAKQPAILCALAALLALALQPAAIEELALERVQAIAVDSAPVQRARQSRAAIQAARVAAFSLPLCGG